MTEKACTIHRLHPAHRDDIGDLVTRRPLPGPALDHLGAFLFLNHHGPQVYPSPNRGLPFGPHPHRGFETITFILTGELTHRDTGGHESTIHAGGVQWMTAGSGLIHAEISSDDFKRRGGAVEILQLWVNLPARLKMTAPRYTGVQADGVPALTEDAGRVRVHLVSGTRGGATGPVASLTGVFMSFAALDAGGTLVAEGLQGRDVFLYVVRGSVAVAGTVAPAFNLVELTPGDRLELVAQEDSVILLGHADPIDEPIVSHGPFVMNSVAEIHQAYADLQAGKFGTMG
ncbi:nuclease PIN [Novosphingobium sp. AAP1]|uniref:pirin family protein n=1 Tax=Novosphingobium sp. AAP1 TaxID=1523413 RepID=UPI0006B8D666|nr:pirin family protein [Novosphingobium sp. AAP1]KPF55318.1 nuclease PIN [Novosphingobium sp. AAP1]